MEEDNKKIEDLIDKLMSVESLEQPSPDFTTNVMFQVEAIANSSVTTYKPLIPKYIWILISCGCIALVGYIYLKEPVASNGWLEQLNLSNVSHNLLENLNEKFSKTTIYAFVLLAVMISIQIPLLKKYFNKHLSV